MEARRKGANERRATATASLCRRRQKEAEAKDTAAAAAAVESYPIQAASQFAVTSVFPSFSVLWQWL